MTTDTDGTVETVAGALRQLVVTDGIVAGRIWQDGAPSNPTFPYCTIEDAIAIGRALAGDGGDLMLERTMQLSLWERLREEDHRVKRRLRSAVHGQRIFLPGTTVVRLRVDSTARLVEEANNIVQHALTITARHDPTAF